jgi:glycerate kinase
MRIIIAPDSFKGTLSAVEVCEHIERGIKKVLPEAEIVKIPISDGGEGLVQVMVSATGGTIKKIKTEDPLGREIESHYGILGCGTTAVIEMAASSGLPLLKKEEQNPLITSTFGTGQLIKTALDDGVNKIIVGIGGSATVDGGTGMAAALGVRFLDADGKELGRGGGKLSELYKIDVSHRDLRLENTEILVACDVDNPLTGEKGAARVYAPQKGADAEMVEVLETGLCHLAGKIREGLNIDVRNQAGAGAAGGLGAGLMAFIGGKLRPGIEIALDNVGFDVEAEKADLVITGEGKIDHQTICGKVPVGVSTRAGKYNCPVIAIAGGVGERLEKLHELNIVSYFSIINLIMPEDEIYKHTPAMLELCSEQVIRTLLLGRKL